MVVLKKPFDNIEVLQLAIAMTEKWRLYQQPSFIWMILKDWFKSARSHWKSQDRSDLRSSVQFPNSGCLSAANSCNGGL